MRVVLRDMCAELTHAWSDAYLRHRTIERLEVLQDELNEIVARGCTGLKSYRVSLISDERAYTYEGIPMQVVPPEEPVNG